MTEEIIKFAFSAGELAPHLHGRADLENYDLGLAFSRNFFVDYRGGASTRAGTRFGEFIQDEGEPVRIIRFRFNTSVANTYLLVFSKDKLRFVQDGAYVLESTSVNISAISKADPGVVTTSSAHGYSTGDWVYLTGMNGMGDLIGRVIEVGATASNTFEVLDHNGANIDTTGFAAYLGAGTVSRIYTITSPYATGDLRQLKFHQRGDEVAFTHPDYEVRILTRVAHDNWTLAAQTIGATLAAPANISLNPSGAGTAGYAVTVTAVDADGIESLPARYEFETTSVDFTLTAGSLEITWDAVAGAIHYNVYRTKVLPTGTEVTYAEQVGFIGRALGPRFVDNNIIPDFASTPPKYDNPFAHGAIESITITAPGTLYDRDDTVTVSGGGGSGFVGYPIINEAGAVLGVVIVNPGSGYSSPTVAFGTSTGSGATATATAGAADGNDPAAVTVYSQRRTFGGSDNNPLTVHGSKVLDFDNFDKSDIPNAADAYEYTLDSDEVNPIRHLMSARNGLLVFTKTEVALMQGVDNAPISATGAEADGQIAPGASHTRPLFINGEVMYVREKGAAVLAMTYNGFSRSWEQKDLSALSSHFFDHDNEILQWDYAEHPARVLWAALDDGTFLSFTYLPEQKVNAWTLNDTKGLVEDIVVLEEDGTDVPYLVVQRLLGGVWNRMFEMMQPRDVEHVEDSWAVDCGLSLASTKPAAELTASASSGTGVTFTADASVFASGDVGKVLRLGGGKAVITGFTSGTVVVGNWEREMTDFLQQDDAETPIPVPSGEWTMDSPVTSVGGLWHAEGETVRILADGNVKTEQTVVNGSVSFSPAATRVTVGLGFDATLKTLPLTMQGVTIEGKRKAVKALIVRVLESRGLSLGERLTSMYEMKDRSTEEWGDPTRLRSDLRKVPIQGAFDEEGQVFFQQTYPLPATVLGYVVEVDIGDV